MSNGGPKFGSGLMTRAVADVYWAAAIAYGDPSLNGRNAYRFQRSIICFWMLPSLSKVKAS